jgi:hypothetical protein
MDGGCYIYTPSRATLDEKLRELKEIDPKLHEIWEHTHEKDFKSDDPKNIQLLIELLEKSIKEKGLTLNLPSEPGSDGSWSVTIERTIIAQGDAYVFTKTCVSEFKEEALLGSYLMYIKEHPH